jgi:hypothetical protein
VPPADNYSTPPDVDCEQPPPAAYDPLGIERDLERQRKCAERELERMINSRPIPRWERNAIRCMQLGWEESAPPSALFLEANTCPERSLARRAGVS